MEKIIDVTFPGGKKVFAKTGGMVIATDQSIPSGGDGSAPEPFTLFLASIATCAGYYALEFCLSRAISTSGMSLSATCSFDEQLRRYTSISLRLTLPGAFPEKYREAIVRAMDSCAVKKHLLSPPTIAVSVT